MYKANNKRTFNISGRGYVKENNAGGEIISFIPEVPEMRMFLDDLVFILTIPSEEQKYAPAYCRLQDKAKASNSPREMLDEDFSQIRSVGLLRQKRGELIVCAPRDHIMVDLSKLVVIATIPAEGKFSAPCYFRKKTYDKSKSELEGGDEVYEIIEEVQEFDEQDAVIGTIGDDMENPSSEEPVNTFKEAAVIAATVAN